LIARTIHAVEWRYVHYSRKLQHAGPWLSRLLSKIGLGNT
jgi:hypothetical protein